MAGKDPTVEQGEPTALRRGWTTGACATAATRSALHALLFGEFLDPVEITLPGGQRPSFALVQEKAMEGSKQAAIIKDAGDDPDVTHGAIVRSTVKFSPTGSGITFHAGEGVGTVTRPGLPIKVGQAAINPVPREMMTQVVTELCAKAGKTTDIEIEISIDGGAELALKTWNPRLGIVGGLSILGTTGIVVPYSCAAWIHSIHRGIDVARAMNLSHVVGSTGDRSEKAAMELLNLPQSAYLDMGDFAGGLLKYLQRNPVSRLTISGGFGKMSKLAQGHLDLHSARSQVDIAFLGQQMQALGFSKTKFKESEKAKSAAQILEIAAEQGHILGDRIAKLAAETAQKSLGDAPIIVDCLIVDRSGKVVGNSGNGGK